MSGDAGEPVAAKPGHTGLRRLVHATRFSVAGLRAAWRHETAFRHECWTAAVLLPLALWLGDGAAQRALLIGSALLVLIVELLNSSIETTLDRVGTNHHPLTGRAKDIGSAAVFLSLVLVGTVWGLVAWERLA
jgi:diacylglycerol kinase (ATP)